MVVFGDPQDPALDRVFRALADATRRDIVRRVFEGEPASISELAARYEMSFAAVQKHVSVLEDAGLIAKEPRGRERLIHGRPDEITRVRNLLEELEEMWRARFSQLDAVITDQENRR